MEFNFKSKLIFDSNNDIQPDNYYLNKIIDLLHKTCKNKKINIGFEPCDGGGTGGQGCGNVWIAYEYYFNNIKKIILISSTHVGLDIEIKTRISRKQLLGWYKKASIYWHATGFGVNANSNPEKVEHFGISTVEAMSYGCVPVVINKGGQKEILKGELKKWLWNDKSECVALTRKLIKSKNLLKQEQIKAKQRAQEFNYKKFEDKLWKMVNEK